MGDFLNFNLMKNPANWVIVYLMVMIAALAMGLLVRISKDADTSPAS